jgi:CheY-like chemotaxis protein
VQVRSAGLGRGSEFIVHLPPTAIANDQVHSMVSTETTVVTPIQRRGRIIVADDNRDAAESLSLVLQFVGYEVFTAFDGSEALAIGARERPDAALVDIGMPGMSGHEVARRIRLEAWGKRIVLIALTGWGQDHDKQAAMAAGFDEHLTKPVDPAEVERLLENLLENTESRLPASDNAFKG